MSNFYVFRGNHLALSITLTRNKVAKLTCQDHTIIDTKFARGENLQNKDKS